MQWKWSIDNTECDFENQATLPGVDILAAVHVELALNPTGKKQGECSVLEVLISQMVAWVQNGGFPPPTTSKASTTYVHPLNTTRSA